MANLVLVQGAEMSRGLGALALGLPLHHKEELLFRQIQAAGRGPAQHNLTPQGLVEPRVEARQPRERLTPGRL